MAGIAFPTRHARPLWTGAPGALASPQSSRVLIWIAAGLLFMTALLNFYVFQVSVVATSAYEVQRLERERDEWRANNEQLQLELAKTRSLAWVEYQAIQRLKMVRGEPPLYLSAAVPRRAPPEENLVDDDAPAYEGSSAISAAIIPPWISFLAAQ